MKRAICFLCLTIFALCCFVSCGDSSHSYVDEDKGPYADGYADGLIDGAHNIQERVASHVKDELREIAYNIEDKWGYHPEDALWILENYFYDEISVTDSEMENAIWAIYEYYYDAQEIINTIEDYDLDY